MLDGFTVAGTTGLLRDYMNRLRIFYSTFELSGEPDSGQLVITWTPIPAADAYWVYGAANMQYFEPGPSPGFEYRLSVVPAGTTTWASSNGIRDPDNNWTYLVIAVDGLEQELLKSDRFGEFDFGAAVP